MNQERHCIIHYPQLKLKNKNKLTSLTQTSFQTLKDAKNARIELGLDHLHQIQCDGVPDEFTEGLGYHYECYNNFTRANSLLRKKKPKEVEKPASTSSRPQRWSISRTLFLLQGS